MWHYVRQYLHYGILAALLMVGEVCMDLVQPRLMSEIVDEGVLGASNGGVGDMHVILVVGLAMVVVTVFGGACGAGNNVFANMCVQNIGNLMRKDAFARIMGLSLAQVERFGTGSLITRVTNDITQVEMYVETFIRGAIRTGFMMLGSIVFMFQLNTTFGLVTLAAFPVALVLLVVCLVRATPLFSRLQGLLDQVNAVMQEDLGGVRTIKACVREATEKVRFGEANAKLVATQLRALLIFAFLNPAMNCLMYVVIAVLLLIGGYQVEGGGVTPGIVMAAITYATQLLGSILRLVLLSQELSRGAASWARVKEILNAEASLQSDASEGLPEDTLGEEVLLGVADESEIVRRAAESARRAFSGEPGELGEVKEPERSEEVKKLGASKQLVASVRSAASTQLAVSAQPAASMQPKASEEPALQEPLSDRGKPEENPLAVNSPLLSQKPKEDLSVSAASSSLPLRGLSLSFENVSFSYPNADALVLNHVSFDVEPGQTVAIMGATGSGKSTLALLVPRLFDVNAGTVRVGGVDVRAWPLDQLRESVAVVLQHTELFGTSIAENIAWGRQGATQAEIEQAARIAQAHEFIMHTVHGYDTQLGQRGMSLSGGQRQRIALARAVLKDASLFVFDDATSALDLQTEDRFRRAFAAYRPQATKVIIAQRIASVRHADAIAVLDGKRVAAVGTHDELLQASPLYREIFASQFGEVSDCAGA